MGKVISIQKTIKYIVSDLIMYHSLKGVIIHRKVLIQYTICTRISFVNANINIVHNYFVTFPAS